MTKACMKISDGLEKCAEIAALVTFFVMAFAACAQVISRYIFNNSLTWSEELCRYMFIWTNMLGATMCYKFGAHAVVDFHIKLMPVKLRNLVFLFDNFCILICGLLMAVQGMKVVQVTKNQRSPGLHLPMMYVYLAVVVAGAIICIHAIAFVVGWNKSETGNESEGEEEGA